MIDEVDYADRVGQLRIDMLEDERDEVENSRLRARTCTDSIC